MYHFDKKNVFMAYLGWASTKAVGQRLYRRHMEAQLRIFLYPLVTTQLSAFLNTSDVIGKYFDSLRSQLVTCSMPLFGFSGLVKTEWDSETLRFDNR